MMIILEGIILLQLPKVTESFAAFVAEATIHSAAAVSLSSPSVLPQLHTATSLEATGTSLLMANMIPFVPDFYTVCLLAFLGFALWGDLEEKLNVASTETEATNSTKETKDTKASMVESKKEEIVSATSTTTSTDDNASTPKKKNIGQGLMFGGWLSSSKPQEEAVESNETTESAVDVSIPYDAAARLAYKTGGYRGDYQTFRTAYEQRAVAQVMAKQRERITQESLEQAAAQTQHAAAELARFRKLQSEIVQAEYALQELL